MLLEVIEYSRSMWQNKVDIMSTNAFVREHLFYFCVTAFLAVALASILACQLTNKNPIPLNCGHMFVVHFIW